MMSACTVTIDDIAVAIVIEDATLVKQLPLHCPLRGHYLETTLLGTQPAIVRPLPLTPPRCALCAPI